MKSSVSIFITLACLTASFAAGLYVCDWMFTRHERAALQEKTAAGLTASDPDASTATP